MKAFLKNPLPFRSGQIVKQRDGLFADENGEVRNWDDRRVYLEIGGAVHTFLHSEVRA